MSRLPVAVAPLALALALLAPALPAAAAQFSTRGAESGLLDVPDAEVVEPGSGLLGAELRFDRVAGQPSDAGPLPVYAVAGLVRSLEAGLSLREWGQPGDPRPARLTFGFAAKLRLLAPEGYRPGLAVDATLDRFNYDPVGGARLILSSRADARLRLAAFAGAESEPGGVGVTYGGALAVKIPADLEVVGEALGGPRGANLGLALRWSARPTLGVQLGVNYFPGDDAFRVSLGVSLSPARTPTPAARLEPAPRPTEDEAPPMVAYAEDRPRFRLRIPTFGPDRLGEPGHAQHTPWTPPVAAAGAPPRLTAPPRPGAASAGDLAEGQLREQEALVEARLRTLRQSDAALATREQSAQADARKLGERADRLTTREQQLDAREKRIQLRGVPTPAQRALESQEAQLAAAERQLAATERGLEPTRDAALGSERDAAGREQLERSERERLAALAGLEKAKAKQLDLRRQGLAASQRLVAAFEARLVAKGERVDAVERQLATRTERTDTWQRRVEVRASRLDQMEKRAEEQQRGGPSVGAGVAVPLAVVPGAPKERAVFVMVVKSPTAIMKEPAAAAPGAGERREAVHPGVGVEKAVAAATVVTFISPASQLSELDREAIDGIARLAAREGAEVLIWARAKDASLMSEATRRSEEIKGYVMATASLSPKQVVTRITTRPGALGVDVVVSALREGSALQGGAGSAPAAPAPAPAPAQDKLTSTETGRRRIRDAVLAVQPSIEDCISDQMIRGALKSAEGTLKLTVSAPGRVTGVSTEAGPLAGPELEECLRQASTAWAFPPADAEYEVSVPLTVVGAGAKK